MPRPVPLQTMGVSKYQPHSVGEDNVFTGLCHSVNREVSGQRRGRQVRGNRGECLGVLVLPKLQVNSQKLRVQAPQNLEFE